VTFTVRCGPVFRAAVTWTDAVPDPDAGLTVAHDASDEAVQLHALFVCTVTFVFPPAPASGSAGSLTEKAQGAAACEMSAC